MSAVSLAVQACSSSDTKANAECAYRFCLAVNTVSKCCGIEDFENQISDDVEKIQSNNRHGICDDVSIYGEVWGDFHNALTDIGCGYWSDLYKTIFADRFILYNEQLSYRLNEIPTEVKAQGARAVADYIEKTLLCQQ